MTFERSPMWKTAWFCKNCHGELFFREKMHSHGRCPLCGHKAEGAVTVVATYECAYRMKWVGPWWKLWLPRVRVYAD